MRFRLQAWLELAKLGPYIQGKDFPRTFVYRVPTGLFYMLRV